MKRFVYLIALLLALRGTVAADAPEYLRFFDPDKGFKPAQANLTEVFLQAAGSLECYSSPEPYLHHMQAEHKRIADKYKAKTGHELTKCWPPKLTDEYVGQMIENWNLLSTKLPLDALAKESGRCAREAIRGTNGKGTILMDVFNHHQDAVVADMGGHGPETGFESLKAALAGQLGFGSPELYIAVLAGREKGLSEAERQEYARFLKHDRFTKAEFGELDHFYHGGYDKLTAQGKDEMSRRIWAGTRSKEHDEAQMDAIRAGQAFRDKKGALFAKIDGKTAPEKARKIEGVIDSIFIDLGSLAQSELELAVLELAVDKMAATASSR